MPYLIDSYPDAVGRDSYTRLVIDDAVTTLSFQHVLDGAATSIFSANIAAIFRLRFARFDLVRKWMYWGYLEYTPKGAPQVVYGQDHRSLVLNYTAGGQVVIPDRPATLPSTIENLSVPTPPDMQVTVLVQAATWTTNQGWINFNFRHTFPSVVEKRSATDAWEQTLYYPCLTFDETTANGFETAIGERLQFAAIYKRTDSPTSVNTASGFAMHMEDVRGHSKFASYDLKTRLFTCALRNSIHLSGGAFVRPDVYDMQQGDDFGYGGDKTYYRLRSFRIDGVCAGAPVGWYDAADLYRRWLQARAPELGSYFYAKIPSIAARQPNAPADSMAPHTVIANYGLDGAIDPPVPDSGPLANLARWLEMHPLLNGDPDVPNNPNPAVLTLVQRLKAKFPNPAAVKVEAQTWGIEKAGFYQYLCGFPPLTNRRGPNRFANAVAQLAAEKIVVSVTTDPLSPLFNRGRYAGHVLWDGTTATDFIREPFPAWFRDSDCPVSMTNITDPRTNTKKLFNRVWIVEKPPQTDRDPHSADAATLRKWQKRNEWGEPQERLPVIGSGLYRGTQKQLCPLGEVAQVYLQNWVKPRLLGQGVRIVEFMKHFDSDYFCFHPGHQHIVPHPHMPPQKSADYDNVIGVGAWWVWRLQCIFYDLQEAGKVFDADPVSTFRLSHESPPVEALASHVDEYYTTGPDNELYHFVYSHLLPQHEALGRGGWGIHPGYKEVRKAPSATLVPPTAMLDTSHEPVLSFKYMADMTDAQKKAVLATQSTSYEDWRKTAVDYFEQNFTVQRWGVAPRNYPTGESAPYSYSRCVQDVFHLKANIFVTGRHAVSGLRIMISSTWMEEPFDYVDELLNHAVRAARLQMQFKQYFRRGRMLGETRIISVKGAPPDVIWAWGGGKAARTFSDFRELVEHLEADDPYLGTGWHQKGLADFITNVWDKQFYPDGTFVDITVSPRVVHRVWQHGEGDARRILYAFANVSNADLPVQFMYTRGLDGVASTAPWNRTIHIISPAPPAPDTKPVWLGKVEQNLVIPRRSFAAVEIAK